jgi:4-methylaminobutanoate oxidase (formaldehyde-forming)
LGLDDVVLLERKSLTSGTTWHAAGLVGLVRPSETQTRMLEYAAKLFAELEDETGLGTGYVKKGTIYLALNEARLEVLRRTVSHAMNLSITDIRMLVPEEAQEKWPLLNTEGVVGASWVGGTGQVNPVDATQSLAKGARMGGAKILERTNVLSILQKDGRTIGVSTDRGDIQADIVILAAGMWTRHLAKAAGVNVPLHAAEHFYLVSETIAGISPMTPSLFCADERGYYKEDAGKLLVGTFEKHAKPWATHGIPHDSEYESFAVDLDHYAEFLELSVGRVPALESAGIRTFFSGPESFTPDGREFLGEAPELRNLFICAGLNSHGIMAAPGSGKIMAEWIRDRQPPISMWGYEISRAMPFQASRRYLWERTEESMGLVMDIPWPGKQMNSARGVRRVPHHRELKDAGAQFGERYGWEVPLYYASPAEQERIGYRMGQQDWFPIVRKECLATRDRVALYEQSNYPRYLVQGRDAVRTLNWICANDIDVAPGSMVYTQWLNARGGIEADVTVTRLRDECFMVMSAPPSQVKDPAWIMRQAPEGADVDVIDVTSKYAMFAVMGPHSRQMLQELTDEDLSNAAFPFAATREIDLGYARVRLSRLTYVGELGFEVMATTDVAGYVYETLKAAGAAYGCQTARKVAPRLECAPAGRQDQAAVLAKSRAC